MSWIPCPGDLVGVKKMGIQGIVVASYETKVGLALFGVNCGRAVVLVNGSQEEYTWTDLFHIPTDDSDDE